MNERDAALAAIGAWRAQRAWARRDPATLKVDRVEPVGPTQIALISRYESRGVRYALAAAPNRPTHNERGPDPWGVRLAHPEGAPVGHEVQTTISGTTVHMDCAMCSGNGEMKCERCDGSGRIRAGRSSYTCTDCHGRGQLTCEQCTGSGGLIGTPSVWSRLEQHEQLQVHEPTELPLDVFLALSERSHGGEVIHRQQADRIVDLRRGGGYRDAASGPDPVREIVQKLGEAPGVPEGGRILGQRLEIRRVPAWRIALEGGTSMWVYGEPPQVSPANALPSSQLRAAKVGATVLGLATGIGLVWLLAQVLLR